MSNFDRPFRASTPVRVSPHCHERLRLYGFSGSHLAAALGPWFLTDGHLSCRRADRRVDAAELLNPEPGDPVLIGRSDAYGPDTRWLVLGRTPTGRRAHMVVVGHGNRVDLVTTWCPDDVDLLASWHRHALLPTELGRRSLPPTHWFYEQPRSGVCAVLAGAR